MIKKITAALILSVVLLGAVACDPGRPSVTTENGTVKETEKTTEKQTEVTEEMTEAITEETVIDEDPVFYEKKDRDPVDPKTVDYSGADWASTIAKANERADGVQGKFTDAKRKKFLVSNQTSSLLYDLTTAGKKQIEGLYNKDGKAYFNDSMDTYFVLPDGTKFSAAYSDESARMNSHRIGYYYYDFRFCGQGFMNPDALKVDGDVTDYYDIIRKSGTWSGHDVNQIKKKDGVLSFKVTSAEDPYLGAYVNFSAEEFDAVQITIKSENTTSGTFYIAAGSQTYFNSEQHTSFRFDAGEWCTVVVPLSVMPDYTGKVTAFRIDCGEQAGEIIEVKELKAIKRGEASVPFALEHIFHTYSDKMHEVVRVVAVADYDKGGRLENSVVIPADTVRKFVLKNAQGETSELDGFDFSTAEYVGFDIKGVGIYGIIMPSLENNGDLKVEYKDGNYIIKHGIDITKEIKKGKDLYFGHRIYTTDSHQFNELRKEAYIERNPLTDVFIAEAADGAKFAGYDALCGTYKFTVNPSDFNKAYYREPDKHYKINALFCGDGVADRTVYIRTWERQGQLECSAILDENGSLLPIPLEVGKNFQGEKEEPLFDPADTAYGEVYVPITVGKDENKRFTLLHLYQNWGKFPLKQLSFIAFHIPYYHLSVGVTESNCIAPYFVYGKDGWTLPDFRANSAPLWSNQPQHTSAGRLYFLQYEDADGNAYKSESQCADIASYGPVYADINMEYLSDDGRIKAEYRHMEMPQTDETRTYYRIRLTVLDDIEINDFRSDFSFFTFDGRGVTYRAVGWLDENGEMKTEKLSKAYDTRFIKLGKEYPYYDYFVGNVTNSVNFALIVKNSDITIGGKKYDGNFIFRDKYDEVLNYGSLTLDLGKTTLKKGDTLNIDMILLPWGYSSSRNDSNVRNVRQDACVDPYRITAIKGTVIDDPYLPQIRAENGVARFTVEGGTNNAVVRVYGFEKYSAPKVKKIVGGTESEYVLAGPNGYDGYQVQLDPDGTYSISFAFDMTGGDKVEFEVTQ
ncbi:MAG: hypothetical protein II777_02595 [Clostridia bacterium]|nr:hypothetical protein [Clostridia bacterium]